MTADSIGYKHLLSNAHDAKRGESDAWAVQSTGPQWPKFVPQVERNLRGDE